MIVALAIAALPIVAGAAFAAAAEELAGIWIASIAANASPEGEYWQGERERTFFITGEPHDLRLHAFNTYDDVSVTGRQIAARTVVRYSLSGSWRGNRPPAAVAEAIDRAAVNASFRGRLGDDRRTITGIDEAVWFYWRGNTLTEIRRVPIAITMRRIDALAAFVRETRKDLVPIDRVAVGQTIRLVLTVSEALPETALSVSMRLLKDQTLVNIDAASVSRSATEPHRYLSAPIEIASPIVEGSRSGSETLPDRYRIWSSGGGRLVAEITGIQDVVVEVIGFSVLEGIMEATSAIAMFALMAFMVERLTNGVALLLGYFPWWRAHFEPPFGGDAALRANNDRNRRLALFVLGIAIAVPLAVGLNLDVLSQLQLPELPPPAAEIGTGLLAATGADPIREIIRSRSQWDVGERASGTTSTIHVEATLVAPPGATIAFPPRAGRGDATAQTERFALAEEPDAYTPTSDAEATSQPPRASGPD